MKKLTLSLILLGISICLFGCGEPDLVISEHPSKEYYLTYDGTTSENAKIFLKDESGENKKIEVEKNKFTLQMPRLTSEITYTVEAKSDKKKTETKIVVPAQKKLIDYEDLKGQFNFTSVTEDSLTISLPDSVTSDEEVISGFRISSDGDNVMAISLKFSADDTYDMSITDYTDFTYSVAAIMMSLDSANSLDKVLEALNNSIEDEKETKVTVDNVNYQFSTLSTGSATYTTLNIFRK
ncbi:hypothetical protein [Listeria seeligeri]|uniref:hypothetical protein n=1 Tax=Listeria seeligeri TaxID=1640 RepID=UPI0022EA3AD5|nr:hypothetical protein [Listeria seeligeri]